MRNIYKILMSILILVAAAMLMSAKEPPNVEPKIQSEMTGGSLDNGVYMQVCCLKDVYYLSDGSRYMSIPVSVEIWDGYLNSFTPRINVTSIVTYQSPVDHNLSIYSFRRKSTDLQGRVRFGYQLENVGTYIIYLSTGRTSYSTIFEVTYAPCNVCG